MPEQRLPGKLKHAGPAPEIAVEQRGKSRPSCNFAHRFRLRRANFDQRSPARNQQRRELRQQ